MAFENEKAQEIFRAAIETYVATRYSEEELAKLFSVVLTDYIAASKGAEEAFELLAELDDALEILRNEGL